jgi:hypothetical protein
MLRILEKRFILPIAKRDEYENAHTHQIVRILMSKFEVLLSRQTDKEVGQLIEYNNSA